MSGNIGYFQKKEGLNIYGARIFRVNTVMSRLHLLKKEQVYHCFFFFFFGGGVGGVDCFSPERVYKSNNFRTRVHWKVVHLSPFEVPDFQVFLSRLPKLTPWKSRLPKFES